MKKLDELWSFNTRDLMRAASCDHCTRLAIARELDLPGVRQLISQFDKPVQGLPVIYGERFEAAIEQELLENLGPNAVQKPQSADPEATIALMRAKVPVIYQGSLKHRIGNLEFSGRPDFLVRGDYILEFVEGKLTARPKVFGQDTHQVFDTESYTAFDAKLAGTAKPHYLLQVALYADALENVGLKANQQHGLILGSRQLAFFDEAEIVPAMRQARQFLINQTSNPISDFELSPENLYCLSTDICSVCEYPDLCADSRLKVDHLSQVAGINRSQIEKLRVHGITTLAQLAAANQSPENLNGETFGKIQKQAALQHSFKTTGQHSFEILPDPELQVLPPSNQFDVFFDIEGFPFYEERGGLEYLWGATLRDGSFHPWWAHNRDQEKLAFEGFVTWAYQLMQQHPEAHIYHYAQYEITALNRMVQRHGTMSAEVSWLLEEGRFIDLYKVVRGSIQISQPSYSIKKLEVFYDLGREGDVTDAMGSVESYENYRQLMQSNELDKAQIELASIGDYNRADCISTQKLYDWLAGMPAAATLYEHHRAVVDRKKRERADQTEEERAGTKSEIELAQLQQTTDKIAQALANWPWGKDHEADYRAKIWLALVHSVLFYKREEVVFWRDLLIKRDAPLEALERDRTALVVLGCELLDTDPVRSTATYKYQLEPNQVCFLQPGDKLFIRFDYGANQQDTDRGEVISIENGQVLFKRKLGADGTKYEPLALIENTLVMAGSKQETIRDYALFLANEWGDPNLEPPVGFAALDLLMRRPPRLTEGNLAPVIEEEYLPAIIDSVERLDNSVLAIQGPPGTGKTYLGSHTIAHLVAQGKKVAVVANSHSAIENMLHGCIRAGVDPAKIAKQNKKGEKSAKPWVTPSSYAVQENFINRQTGGFVIGGTSWTLSNPKVSSVNFDYLFIDEAAQFSLVDAIAVSAATKNLILLGDPMQLTQVVQAVHPGGVDNSALGHYMGESEIIDETFGYFIEVTRRMHPKVNQPVSWLAYQQRLHSHPSASNQSLPQLEPAFQAIACEHSGNSTYAFEEIEVVLQLVRQHARLTEQSEILVVAPYNAQVDLIRKALSAANFSDVQVGTVDKFQGREGMVVIVSLATSSAADAPRGLEFLLDKNRLNVALSRARTNSYLVFSPGLARSKFSSVAEVKCVSRLVGLLDFADFFPHFSHYPPLAV